MKALVLILLATTSALAVTTVQFAKRANAERERARAELALRQEHEQRLRDLERTQANLQQELANAHEQVERLTKLAQSASRPQSPRASAPGELNARSFERADSQGGGVVSQVMSNAPAARLGPIPPPPFMRAQLRASTRRLYQDAGKFLGLTQEESDKLLDLLTEQQTRGFGERAMPRDPAENRAEIEALIGPARMAQWEQYQKTLPERMQVNALNSQFESAGMPLTEDQRIQLVNVMTETRQQLPPPAATGVLTEEGMSQHQQWQDEFNRLVMERARSILNSEQYEHYRQYQEWQQQMQKFALRNLPRPPAQPGAPGAQPSVTFFGVGPAAVVTDLADSGKE